MVTNLPNRTQLLRPFRLFQPWYKGWDYRFGSGGGNID
uniref:Uncharacterized protein n=1 Tax=Utricularia reniformis TaxID=192314 RepID=A0A1Y0B113_9LAMI|nr:hypothetical protein AEK19_MT0800 [Utricularia reniformis]ART31039.1 hypothetical protein AEK19_MT0800 [Utricularia reniformis]